MAVIRSGCPASSNKAPDFGKMLLRLIVPLAPSSVKPNVAGTESVGTSFTGVTVIVNVVETLASSPVPGT